MKEMRLRTISAEPTVSLLFKIFCCSLIFVVVVPRTEAFLFVHNNNIHQVVFFLKQVRKFDTSTEYSRQYYPLLGSSASSSSDDGFMNEEEPIKIELSLSDLKRLEEMRNRYKIIPLLILDSMLPGQCLEFGSNDPKFLTLIDYVLEQHNLINALEEGRVIGMIGVNPNTGRPMNLGVTLNIDENCVRRQDENYVYIAVKGDRRFQVQGEPWLDDTESFYMAEIEFIENNREGELLNETETVESQKLSNAIPELVDRWLGWVIRKGKSDQAGMDSRMIDIGPIPNEVGARAIWTAALINPLSPLGVCIEIRPAMLACKNDLDRVKLAVAAIRASIDHLSGKRRLF